MFRNRAAKKGTQQPRESAGARPPIFKDTGGARRPIVRPSTSATLPAPAQSAAHVNAPEMRAVNEFADAMRSMGKIKFSIQVPV
jgi:hypothetical protein